MGYEEFIKSLNIKDAKEIKQEEENIEEMIDLLKNKDIKLKVSKQPI